MWTLIQKVCSGVREEDHSWGAQPFQPPTQDNLRAFTSINDNIYDYDILQLFSTIQIDFERQHRQVAIRHKPFGNVKMGTWSDCLDWSTHIELDRLLAGGDG